MEDKIIRNMALSTIGLGGGYATLQAVFGDKKNKAWSEIIQNFTSGILIGGILVIFYTMTKTKSALQKTGLMGAPSMENN